MVKAPVCGTGDRRFESDYPPHLYITQNILYTFCVYIGLSPSGKATDFDSVIRRFESCYPCQVDPLAQSVEHLTFNQGVPRSSRGWITICGLFVKWLRHRPFTAGSGVRIPHRSPSGRLAQLGERLPYKQNVGSSILSSPTKTARWCSGLTCRPVTAEIVSSNLIRVATILPR